VAKRAVVAAKKPAKGAAGVTADDIVLAAVRICDEGGIESLTIRRLAADLNIGTMTLYGYFRGKEEILDGVADYVLGRFQVPRAREQTPVAVATAVGHAFLAMMREHPSVVYLLSSRATMSQQSLKAAMEDVLAQLREAGFDGPVAAKVYAMLITYCLGFASYQHPRPWGRADSPNVSEQRRQRVHFYSSLPLPAFANMVELSESITTMPSDEQFDLGLKCLIDGLTSRTATQPRASSGDRRVKARAD
jgi:AcrR family transcriptional regulator